MSFWSYANAKFYISKDVPIEEIKHVFGEPYTFYEINKLYDCTIGCLDPEEYEISHDFMMHYLTENANKVRDQYESEDKKREGKCPGGIMGSEGSLDYCIEPCKNYYKVNLYGSLRDIENADCIEDFYRQICISLPIIYMYGVAEDWNRHFESKFKRGIYHCDVTNFVEKDFGGGRIEFLEERSTLWNLRV